MYFYEFMNFFRKILTYHPIFNFFQILDKAYKVNYYLVMKYKTITTKDARNGFATLAEDDRLNNVVYIVTKFGKPKLKIIPYLDETETVLKEDRINFRYLANKTKNIFQNKYPGKTTEEIVKILRENIKSINIK